jgi:death-on-curing protein
MRWRSLTGTGSMSATWGLLASALARPATALVGVEVYPQLAMKAAALMESVARFHPLIDGNKGTAWMMVLMFWVNGYRHDFSTYAAFDLVVGVAVGDVSLEVSAEMIAMHLVRR